MSIVEIHQFPASDAFVADQSIAKRLLDILKGTKGLIEHYYGLQIEDNKTGFIVLVWESYEHSVDLRNASHLTFIEAFKALYIDGSQSQIRQVRFDGDTTPAFKAPVTEIVFVGAKEGVANTIEERKEAFYVIAARLKTVKGFKGFHGAIAGEIRGDSDTFSAVLGWDSVDAHVQAVATEEVNPVIEFFMKITSPVVAHVKLIRYD